MRLTYLRFTDLFASGLVIFLLLVGQALAQVPEVSERVTTPIKYEQGVCLRLFSLSAPLERFANLAPGQSPNSDEVIQNLTLTGEEQGLSKHSGSGLVKLSARLRVDFAATYQFQLKSNTMAALEIDGIKVVTSTKTDSTSLGELKLSPGQYQIEVVAALRDKAPQLEVRWAPEKNKPWSPIPNDSLSTGTFAFRPTAPGIKRLISGFDRPGRRQKVEGVYPGLDLNTIHSPEIKVPVGGLAVLSDGTLVVAEFDAQQLSWPKPLPKPNGRLWVYHDSAGDPSAIRRELIAGQLFEPSGVCVVNDVIYLSQRNEILRFEKNSKTSKWEQTTVASGWETIDFHAMSFGLVHEQGEGDHPGYLYMAKGTGLGRRGNPPNHGSVWRIDLSLPSGKNVSAISGGHRTPNGLGIGPKGILLVTNNQGEFTPANELNLVKDKSFYGFYHQLSNTKGAGGNSGVYEPSPFQPIGDQRKKPGAVTEAIVWLPQDEISNSPTQPLMIPKGWPFHGQMLLGDMRYGVNRVSLEEIEGQWQGAVYRFTQGCEGGVNRLAFGPKGELYVGAIGGFQTPTWSWVNPQGNRTDQGLQRLKLNGNQVFDLEEVSIVPGGFEIRFTKSVSDAWLLDIQNYQIQQWGYQATSQYGGPKKDLEELRVTNAKPLPGGKGVRLEISGLKKDRVVYFLLDPVSTEGEKIWSAEAWYTIRKIPEGKQ